MHKIITQQENFEYKFQISKTGICAVLILASCKKGLLGFKGEDLRVEIDDIKFREIPALKNKQYYDISPAWNGNKLKGLTKTVIFILNLKQGDHTIKFFPKNSATLEKEPEIIEFENQNDIQINLNQQAQNGNRRPWITLALVNLPIRILDASIKCEKRFIDSDDVQMIVDGKIQKNESPNKWGKNWRWQGRQMKGATIDERFYLDLEKSDHYIEFLADRMPVINNFWMYLGVEDIVEKENDICENIVCNDPEKISEEFNKNFVIKDRTFNGKNALSEEEIQNFLDDNNTEKSKNHLANLIFDGKKAAHWIKKSSENYSINPKLLLAKLQAEQRLIKGEKSINPTDFQLNGAMGAGMLDDGTIFQELQGFANQINYAAKYFRKFYNEAEGFDFTHKNVDGKELEVVNAATYSLYRYTPHIAGPKLVYDVYKMFFGADDLGGKIKNNPAGNTRLKILFGLGFGILILAIGVFLCFRKKDKKPIYSWKNNVDIGDGWKVSTDLKVFSEKKVTDEDGNYCGFRFGKIYNSQAKLNLIYNNKIVDTADLTNPELILPDFTEENLRYYKPWDINGDGKDQEFIIQDYSSCNSNAVSFISASKGLKKFEKISIINKNGDEIQSIYADIAEDALKIESGEVDSKNYDMEKGIFVENHYKFNKDKKKLIQEL